MKVKVFSLSKYVEQALRGADYQHDESGVVIARVPRASGFFAQGDSFEEARENLRDVIEGNVILALQLGLPIPVMKGVDIEERRVPRSARTHGKAHAPKGHGRHS